MHSNTVTSLNAHAFGVPAMIFEARENAGPLTPMEECYRFVCTCAFSQLIECDAAMGQAQLTHLGKRWLAPIVRGIQAPGEHFPLSALDWIKLYHQARDQALRHFSEWNRNTMPLHVDQQKNLTFPADQATGSTGVAQ